MSRYIDADELLKKAIYPFIESDMKVVTVEDIKSAPTADVKPIVYGEWKFANKEEVGELERFNYKVCSICGYGYLIQWFLDAKFCPNCGADMRKESEAEE